MQAALPRNVKLTIEYDGSAYHGWQRQANAITVQQVLEEAIAGLVGHPVTLHGSGRTDAGVHALGQVASFETHTTILANRLHHAINTVLPPDITVLRAEDVPATFHARFSATGKTYCYRILCRHVRPSIGRERVHWLRRRLDVADMQQAAALCVGEHDFAAFESESSGDNSVRTVTRCDVEALPDHGGEWIDVTVSANGFLYNMVRTMVGTLIEIGSGKQPPEWVADLLESRDRTLAGPTAPAKGLCLLEVNYE